MRLLITILATFVFASFISAQNDINFEEIEKQELKEFTTTNEKDSYDTHLSPNHIDGTIWVNDSIIGLVPNYEDEWVPVDLYEAQSRNLRGQNTSGIKRRIDWDNLEWENIYIDTATYYNNGSKKSHLKLDWNETDEKFSDSVFLRTYNENGERLLSINYKHSKDQYTYNNGNVIKFERLKWNYIDEIWENFVIITSEYGENKEWKKQIFKIWNKDKENFENKSKYFYTYENNNIVKSESFTWDLGSEQWIPKYLSNYSYNEDGNRELSIYQKWNAEENKWVNSDKYVYSYNSLNLLKESISQYWGDSFWDYSTKNSYEYNSVGKRTLSLNEEWADSTWVNKEKITYKYKDDIHISEHSQFIWETDSLKWIPTSKDLTNYDNYYNKIETISLVDFSSTGELHKNRKNIYTWSQFEVSGTSESEINSINIYPNPTRDFFIIAGLNNAEVHSIRIYNLSGKLVKSINGLTNNFVDIKSLNKGLYFVKLTTKTGVITRKLIKQ